jgi:hypothetical protein
MHHEEPGAAKPQSKMRRQFTAKNAKKEMRFVGAGFKPALFPVLIVVVAQVHESRNSLSF